MTSDIPAFECARCGCPAERYDPRTGLTHHLDVRKYPCRTATPGLADIPEGGTDE